MGASSMHRDAGMTTHEFLEKELCGETCGRFLASGIRNTGDFEWPSTFYAAWELGDGHGVDAGKVTALVCYFRYGGGGYFNFTYKAWTESALPDHEAPLKVLALLTETDDENELLWRERCRAWNAKRAAKPKVRTGDTIVFATPIEFENGDTIDTFVKQKGDNFKAVADFGPYGNYRIRRWRDREFTVKAA